MKLQNEIFYRILSIVIIFFVVFPSYENLYPRAEVFELHAGNFETFPVEFKRPASGPLTYAIISSKRYLAIFNNVKLNKNEIHLAAQSSAFRENYEKQIARQMLIFCNFFSSTETAAHFDDALFYGYTFQDALSLPTEKKIILQKKFIHNIAVTYQNFPSVIQFTFWPYMQTEEGYAFKLDGLYIPSGEPSGSGESIKNTIMLSLFDTFTYSALAQAVQKQNPEIYRNFDLEGGYVNKMGSWASNLANNMPLIQTFIHENTHCVFQFYNPEPYPNEAIDHARFLFEGITELLTHRVVFYLCKGYEDFNVLHSYPLETLTAALLFSVDPEGLLNWYTRETPDFNLVFTRRFADKLQDIKSRRGEPVLQAQHREQFITKFTQSILSGTISKPQDIVSIFSDTKCNNALLLEWIMDEGIYFRQIPLRIQAFVLKHFFGIQPLIAKNAEQHINKIKGIQSKSGTPNWTNPKKHPITGFVADNNADKEFQGTPVQIILIPEDPQKTDINEDGRSKKRLLTTLGMVETKEELEKLKGKEVQMEVFHPDNAMDARTGMPNVAEWFKNYRNKNISLIPKEKGYLMHLDKLIKDPSAANIFTVTAYVLRTGSPVGKDEVREWHDFLSEYLEPKLEEGKDSLRINEIKGLLFILQ